MTLSDAQGELEPLALNPWYVVVRHDDAEVQIRHGFRSLTSFVLRDPAQPPVLGGLLARFAAGPISAVEALAHLSEEQRSHGAALLDELAAMRVLVAADVDAVDAYYGFVHGIEVSPQQKVAIIGHATLAAELADGLASTGLVTVVTYDSDESVRDVASTVEALPDDCDLVVLALDRFSPRTVAAFNDAGLRRRLPFAYLGFDGSEATLGPLVVPGATACLAESDLQARAGIARPGDFAAYRSFLVSAQGSALVERARLPRLVARLAASMFATSVLPWFAFKQSTLMGSVVLIDFERMSLDHVSVLRLPTCAACDRLDESPADWSAVRALEEAGV
jgi:bacteriocin biosynthesis cyclodehydratase domain-containing protein